MRLGVSPQRLRARDIERVARSVYRVIGTTTVVEDRARALSVATDHGAARQPGNVGHSVILREGEVAVWNGIRMSTPARTWLDLAAKMSLPDAVCLGDQLLRVPRASFEERSTPWNTRSELATLLSGHPNLPGIVTAKAALQMMRVGADSPPETKLRLALMEWGLPEPELQVRVDPEDP